MDKRKHGVLENGATYINGTSRCDPADIVIGTIAGQALNPKTNHPHPTTTSCPIEIKYTGQNLPASRKYAIRDIESLLVLDQDIDKFPI